jgi:Cu(I)/Ag(I) efflux system membrane protein CusA/SilA
MIDRLIELSVRRRGLVILLSAVAALLGVFAIRSTPIDAVPDLSENQVIVYADWSGHGPEEIEQQLTYPLSLSLRGISDLKAARGSSDVGRSTLYLIFDDHITFPVARRRVAEKLAESTAALPTGVSARLAPDGIPTGQIFWYTVEGQGLNLGELRAIQDWTVAPQLGSLPGVAEVASVGGFVREIQIIVDPPRLLAAGLTIADLASALEKSQSSIGGNVVVKGNAEFVVQLDTPQSKAEADPFGLHSFEDLVIPAPSEANVRLADVARVALGPAPRRGMLEKDGNEAVGGIVHIRYGHNPLEVIEAVKARLLELQSSLPAGVRVVPCYDRTPLIKGSIATVSRTLIEAIIVSCLCIVLILRHWKASLVIAISLPLVVLCAFLLMSLLRQAGVVDIQTNIMSLAGIAISIGILVDSSIVVTENVMHSLHRRYGSRPVGSDRERIVIQACQAVGRPVFFSLLIMLVSFLPVFALGGIDGRMYAPLAWTKSLSIVAAALLALTLVPALAMVLIRGTIRDESSNALVQTVISVYRPVLSMLIDRPAPLIWFLSATFVLAAAAVGSRWLLLAVLAAGVFAAGLLFQNNRGRTLAITFLVMLGLGAESMMSPIRMELRMPLNEGMVMDMPISVPRASITQSGDDVKARDMVLCRFPEVQMAVGKAGRAETPFDPAPLDMIETMIEFRPRENWPRRRLLPSQAADLTGIVWTDLKASGLIQQPSDAAADSAIVLPSVEAALTRFDAALRELCHLKIQERLRPIHRNLTRQLIERTVSRLASHGALASPPSASEIAALQERLPILPLVDLAITQSRLQLDPVLTELVRQIAQDRPSSAEQLVLTSTDRDDIVAGMHAAAHSAWLTLTPEINAEALRRASPLWTRIIAEELLSRARITDAALVEVLRQAEIARRGLARSVQPDQAGGEHHHSFEPLSELPLIDPHPTFDGLLKRSSERIAKSLTLTQHDPESLAGFGGEMDRLLQMPGWTNVWTKPIQNRVDMLATGVNAEVGVRVLGRNLDDVVKASEDVAAALRLLPGAADVVADPLRGKGYLRITPDSRRAAVANVSLSDLNSTVEAALGGRVIGQRLVGGERIPVRLRLQNQGDDEQSLQHLLIPSQRTATSEISSVTLSSVADVSIQEGPATIKSENGWLRNFVRLNVRDRDVLEFVAQARRVVESQVPLPPGVFLEWTGQYEHSLETRRSMLILVPTVLLLIAVMLYITYRDWSDALTMALVAPGAIAGGILCQWLLGYPFSIAVGVGYIACFGMAAATGIVMLVYLRQAVDQAGGLENISLAGLREAVLVGAVHRLRPKLLTEATTILGLAPILWSTGVGAEVIRPMAAPVLGGLLIADEVIDLLLPILFFHVRRHRWYKLHPVRMTTQTAPHPGYGAHLISQMTNDSSSKSVDLWRVRARR